MDTLALTSTVVNMFPGGPAMSSHTAKKRLRMADCCSVLAAPITDPLAVELAEAFAALADPVRLRLFSMIASAGTCCSCDLIEPIGKSQPTVSHHTKVLADAGLITGQKIGRWVNWTVAETKVD